TLGDNGDMDASATPRHTCNGDDVTVAPNVVRADTEDSIAATASSRQQARGRSPRRRPGRMASNRLGLAARFHLDIAPRGAHFAGRTYRLAAGGRTGVAARSDRLSAADPTGLLRSGPTRWCIASFSFLFAAGDQTCPRHRRYYLREPIGARPVTVSCC